MYFNSSIAKGNQRKWACDGVFYKEDAFAGEGLSEYLVSLVLESSKPPVHYALYRLNSPMVVMSPLWRSDVKYIPFTLLLKRYVKNEPWFKNRAKNKKDYENYWVKRVWSTKSPKERVDYVIEVFNSAGVSKESTLRYLTVMVELDTLVVNIDRHFKNFGIFERRTSLGVLREPALLFDHGLSLSTSFEKFDLRRVKMQPFATKLSHNRSALPPFKLDFDVERFVDLLMSTNPLGIQYLTSTPQYKTLRNRLVTYYQVDKNKRDIDTYLKNKGL